MQRLGFGYSMFVYTGLLVSNLSLLSCSHTQTKNIERAPQSVSSPSSTVEALAFVADFISRADLEPNLRAFNRQAVTLCWQNPAWDKLDFSDEARKRYAKIFLCNVPVQFRLCHTVKFLQIEKKFAKNPAKKSAAQDYTFNECDQKRTRYIRTAYKMNERSLNAYTNGQLAELYTLVMRNRHVDLPEDLKAALEQVHPSRIFNVEENSLGKELAFTDALKLAADGYGYGIEFEDIVNLVRAAIESKLPANTPL